MSAKPLPYAVYKKLSASEKAKLKASLQAKPRVYRSRKAAPRTVRRVRTKGLGGVSSGDLIAEGASRLGKMAISALPAVLSGFGDYQLPSFKPEQNTIMNAILSNGGPPNLQSTASRSHIIRHREYLGDVITGATAGFNSTAYYINPGLSASFPWLAALAQNFEQYRINGMVYEFKSTSADALNSTNTALGSIIMCTEYNAGNALFVNKQQMENHEFCSSAKQSCSILHPIECKRSQTPVSELFVRVGSVPTGQDAKLYDLGIFQIATVGQQGASVNIGELWVTYEIEFFKPQLDNALGYEILSDHWFSSTGVSTSAYFGTANTLRVGSSLNCTLGTSTITFPAWVTEGSYAICVQWFGTNTANAASPNFVATTNCSTLSIMKNDTDYALAAAASTNTSVPVVVIIKITGPSAVVTLSNGVLPSTVTYMDLFITQFNAAIVT